MAPLPLHRPNRQSAASAAWSFLKDYGPVTLIGLIFTAASILKLLGAAVQVSFSGGDLPQAFAFKSDAYVGIFIVAMIVMVGLLRKQRWARYTGVILGPVLVLPDFMEFYAESDAGLRREMLSILGRAEYVWYVTSILCGSLYLACFRSAADRSRYRFVTLALAGMLSLSVTTLTAASILKLHAVVYHYRHDLTLAAQAAERQAQAGEVRRGIPYRNSDYGFELTFPDDRKIYRQGSGSSVEFSLTGLDGPGALYVWVENTFDHQDTAEGVVRLDRSADNRNHDSVDTINGIPCARLQHWAGHVSYVFVRNGKVIHLEERGGMDNATVDQIARTFHFI